MSFTVQSDIVKPFFKKSRLKTRITTNVENNNGKRQTSVDKTNTTRNFRHSDGIATILLFKPWQYKFTI